MVGIRAVTALVGLVPAALSLGGCVVTPTAVAVTGVGAGMVSLTSTKKTLSDHLISAATGEDCSSVTFTQTGRYCPEAVVADRSRIYCYRTLADVECHHIPDPYRNGSTALASPPPDLRPVPKAKGWFDDWPSGE